MAQECDLIWKQSHCRGWLVTRWDHTRSRVWGFYLHYDCCPSKKGTETPRGRTVMWEQRQRLQCYSWKPQECQGRPANTSRHLEEGGSILPYRFPWEHGPRQYSDFRLRASRTVRGQISACFLSHPVMVHQGFFGSLRKWNTMSNFVEPALKGRQRKTLYASAPFTLFLWVQVYFSRDSRSAHRNEVLLLASIPTVK